MENIARTLMLGGIALFLIGGGIYFAAKFGLPLGRLPGDIHIEGENGGFYFPVTSSILVSVILTILVNLIIRFWKKYEEELTLVGGKSHQAWTIRDRAC
ncbi:DUF2905 domain-containing protein [Candidatus Villigracilis saccharophilus]|uniref:DUF2905 domain-containing protein n=1 Tax=Candidatus Villigracilis saccharophilus TaxID=3140684 RepID=UPI0031352E75|nr:DUF2905 domain-containing protein [Anaerolineales bacterium]